MEQPSDGLYEQRAQAVTQDEKKRLFLLAGRLMLAGEADVQSTEIFRSEPFYYDSNGDIARYRTLVMDSEQDRAWRPFLSAGIASLELHYWPERAQPNQPPEPDQINLYMRHSNEDAELFTMKARFDGAESRTQLGNRLEIKARDDQWIEASRADTDRVTYALEAADKILGPSSNND